MNEEIEFTMSDVAAIIGVTRATIYNRQAAGQLPSGSGLQILRAEVERQERELSELKARIRVAINERIALPS